MIFVQFLFFLNAFILDLSQIRKISRPNIDWDFKKPFKLVHTHRGYPVRGEKLRQGYFSITPCQKFEVIF